MKLVTIVIDPHRVDDVRNAFSSLGVQGATLTEIEGYGRHCGQAEFYRGAEYDKRFRPKIKLETAVHDDVYEQVIEAVVAAARTGRVGDGSILVTELEQVTRVRTGEISEAAI